MRTDRVDVSRVETILRRHPKIAALKKRRIRIIALGPKPSTKRRRDASIPDTPLLAALKAWRLERSRAYRRSCMLRRRKRSAPPLDRQAPDDSFRSARRGNPS